MLGVEQRPRKSWTVWEEGGKYWRWSPQLELFLGIHEGQLRFFSPEGVLLPTPEEAAETEQQQKEAERQQKERLAAKLRELGVDPDQV